MFTSATHALVGQTLIYCPAGFAPMTEDQAREGQGQLVTYPGDTVTVLSAWDRDYLESAPILLYVRSATTGLATHVSAEDLTTIHA